MKTIKKLIVAAVMAAGVATSAQAGLMDLIAEHPNVAASVVATTAATAGFLAAVATSHYEPLMTKVQSLYRAHLGSSTATLNQYTEHAENTFKVAAVLAAVACGFAGFFGTKAIVA